MHVHLRVGSARRRAIREKEIEGKIMGRIFSGLQNSAVPRDVMDVVYNVLADAEAQGNGRSWSGAQCELCMRMCGTRVTETVRHTATGCECNMLVQEAMLRAAFQTSMVDHEQRVRTAALTWRDLLEDQRRLLVSGYPHCASGQLIAEERVGHVPFRVLMQLMMAALIQRRRTNAASALLRARVDVVYTNVIAMLQASNRGMDTKACIQDGGTPRHPPPRLETQGRRGACGRMAQGVGCERFLLRGCGWALLPPADAINARMSAALRSTPSPVSLLTALL